MESGPLRRDVVSLFLPVIQDEPMAVKHRALKPILAERTYSTRLRATGRPPARERDLPAEFPVARCSQHMPSSCWRGTLSRHSYPQNYTR